MRRFVTVGSDGDPDLVSRLPLGHTLTGAHIFKHVVDAVCVRVSFY